jgi:hypothetical protein
MLSLPGFLALVSGLNTIGGAETGEVDAEASGEVDIGV